MNVNLWNSTLKIGDDDDDQIGEVPFIKYSFQIDFNANGKG